VDGLLSLNGPAHLRLQLTDYKIVHCAHDDFVFLTIDMFSSDSSLKVTDFFVIQQNSVLYKKGTNPYMWIYVCMSVSKRRSMLSDT